MLKKTLPFVCILFAVSCHAPVSVQTPEGKAAYKADQVISALGIFQDAAIGANSQHLLNDNSTRLIVNFVKSSVLVAQQSPNGWRPSVLVALDRLRVELPPADASKYKSYLDLLTVLIGSV